MIRTLVLLTAAASLTWAQAGGAAQPQKIQMLKPGLFLVTGAGGNTSVRVTKAGLIVVDTKNLGVPFYNDLMAQIRSVSDKPVKFVIVTHHHQDHSGNIKNFEDAGATVIANEGLAEALQTYAPAQGKPAQPTVMYTKDYKVKLGGIKVEVHHYGRGHTGGDSIVYFPDLKVVQTGDVVVGVVPNIDFPFDGSVIGWQTQLEAISRLNFDMLIPGHSAPNQTTMTRADFIKFKMNFDTLVARAKELVKAGTPKEQLIAKIKTDDLGWNINTLQWTQPARLDPFYEEMKNAK